MRLKKIELTNFRCFSREDVELDSYTSLVGENNVGKSAILTALDYFFQTTPKSTPITAADFGKNTPDRPLKILLEFNELTKPEREAFEHYYRPDSLRLCVAATLGPKGVTAKIHGERIGIEEFAPFFAAGTAKDKRETYNSLAVKFSLPAWSNAEAGEKALRDFETSHPESCAIIPSESQAYGAEGAISRLKNHFSWVYIPAVKDAKEEQTENKQSALAILIDRLLRSRINVESRLEAIRTKAVEDISLLSANFADEVSTIQDRLSSEFRGMIASNASVNLDWAPLDQQALKLTLPAIQAAIVDDLGKSDLTRVGHGLQRAYLLALLKLANELPATDDHTPRLLLACEEPELYQHPPQARTLAESLRSLATKNAQVIVSTHSRHFVDGRKFGSIRRVSRTNGISSKVHFWTPAEHRDLIASTKNEAPIGLGAVSAKIDGLLDQDASEIFFSGRPVLVEGPEDIALISATLRKLGRYDTFVRCSGHLISANGKPNLINLITLCRGFSIPYTTIFDLDLDQPKPEELAKNKALNQLLLDLAGEKSTTMTATKDQWSFGKRVITFDNNTQAAFEKAIGTEWTQTRAKIASELGWTVDQLKKTPTLLELLVDRLIDDRNSFATELCDRLLSLVGTPIGAS